jgi:hypothetical protein
MALRTFISNLFRKQPTPATTLSGEGQRSEMSGVALMERLKADSERRAVVATCRWMYKTDPRVKKMHTTLASDLVRGGYVVKCDNPEAKQIADNLQTRLGMNQRCEDYSRLTARDGDSFLELGIDADLNITKISRKPTLLMHRASDDADQFVNPARAFWMANPNSYSPPDELTPPADATWFAEWQMIHLRWEHDEENRYGTAMMAPATSAFKRVQEGEQDVAVRRKTRSGIRYLHTVEGGQADVEAYKEQNKAALTNPLSAAVSDFFSNKKGTIEAIEGEGTALNAIEDVKHHIETMATASDVPLGLIGYGGGLNRDILADQKEQYTETLDQGREWLSDQFIVPLLERQWLLKGILPASIKYRITWRPRVSLTPILIRDLADALLKLKLLQVSDADISAIMQYFLPGVELDAATMAAASAGDSERFASMLKGLSI